MVYSALKYSALVVSVKVVVAVAVVGVIVVVASEALVQYAIPAAATEIGSGDSLDVAAAGCDEVVATESDIGSRGLVA